MTTPHTLTFLSVEEDVVPVTRVRVVDGPEPRGTHVLGGSRALVGSSEQCDVRLFDRRVSRLHCELVRAPGGVRIRDLGSKNGCWIAGQRVIEAVLAPGAQVRVGGTTLELHVDTQRTAVERWTGGDRFGGVVGEDASMRSLFALAARAAESQEPILIRGEQGTGKELLARAIHDAGPRREGPFVVLDCAALGIELAELELFGHAKGAFTGAAAARMGIVERAEGGTLFLAHLHQLPLDVQPKLLRLLERRTVRRLGENVDRHVDVRFIASAHGPLEELVNQGLFREDILYRTSVFVLDVPPLRDRVDDVARIAREMLAELGPAEAEDVQALERELERRRGYGWPGNVRELRSVVRRVVLLGGELAHLVGPAPAANAPPVDTSVPFHEARNRVLERFERAYLGRLLAQADGNVSEAARRAGLNRTYLHKLLARVIELDSD